MLLDTERNRRVIDGTRSLGIILVICFHVILGLSRTLERDQLAAFAERFPGLFNITWQALGSELIFLISGFLLSYILIREFQRRDTIDIGDFYVRRLARILPLYIVALCLYALIAEFTFRDLGLNLLFVSKAFDAKTIIPVGWAFEVLVQAYLILPLLVLALYRMRHPAMLIVLAIVASLGVRYLAIIDDPSAYRTPLFENYLGREFTETQKDLYYLLVYRATPFLLGLGLAHAVITYHQGLARWLGRAWVNLPLTLLALAMLAGSAFLPMQDGTSALYTLAGEQFWLWFWTLQRFVFGISICLLLMCTWYGRNFLLAPFAWVLQQRLWIKMSRDIYAIYLFHLLFLIPAAMLAFRTIHQDAIGPAHPLEIVAIFVLVTVLSAACGQLATRFIETPAHRWILTQVKEIRMRLPAPIGR